MILSPWFGRNSDPSQWHPEKIVWTLYDEEAGGMCDMAWESEIECLRHGHHWWTFFNPKVIHMPVRDFLKDHVEGIVPMNSFEGLGRIEFMDKWNKHWAKEYLANGRVS